jgi:hypothetical protein
MKHTTINLYQSILQLVKKAKILGATFNQIFELGYMYNVTNFNSVKLDENILNDKKIKLGIVISPINYLRLREQKNFLNEILSIGFFIYKENQIKALNDSKIIEIRMIEKKYNELLANFESEV